MRPLEDGRQRLGQRGGERAAGEDGAGACWLRVCLFVYVRYGWICRAWRIPPCRATPTHRGRAGRARR